MNTNGSGSEVERGESNPGATLNPETGEVSTLEEQFAAEVLASGGDKARVAAATIRYQRAKQEAEKAVASKALDALKAEAKAFGSRNVHNLPYLFDGTSGSAEIKGADVEIGGTVYRMSWKRTLKIG